MAVPLEVEGRRIVNIQPPVVTTQGGERVRIASLPVGGGSYSLQEAAGVASRLRSEGRTFTVEPVRRPGVR